MEPTEEDHGYVGNSEDGSAVMCWWHINRLWRLAADMPVERIALSSLTHVLDEEPWQPHTKREMAKMARRIWNADLECPIIFSAQGRLLDGSHRLMKAYAFELPDIKAVRFAQNPEPDYRATHEELSQLLLGRGKQEQG